jgi:hypothetical protein
VHHRVALRDPGEIWRAFGRLLDGRRAERVEPTGIDGVIGPDGEGLSARPLVYTGPGPGSRFLETELLADYELSDDQVESAEDMVRALHDDGVAVTLLILPVTDDYIDAHPRGTADFEEYRATMRAIADRTGTDLVDLSTESFGDTQFADPHHLNEGGMVAASSELAELVPTDGEACS